MKYIFRPLYVASVHGDVIKEVHAIEEGIALINEYESNDDEHCKVWPA